MKRGPSAVEVYAIFAYDDYYPNGGMDDCRFITADKAEAEAKYQKVIGPKSVSSMELHFLYDREDWWELNNWENVELVLITDNEYKIIASRR